MNKRTLVSEEKVFGDNFIIIRRKYMPEYDNKKNIFEAYLEKENRL